MAVNLFFKTSPDFGRKLPKVIRGILQFDIFIFGSFYFFIALQSQEKGKKPHF
jgi:hypothetical protein